MKVTSTRLLVFARAPIPGQAKTRLIPALGAHQAARLQAAFIQRTVAMCATAGLGAVELWCTPDTKHPLFTRLAAQYPLSLHRQAPGDLGIKMSNALACALQQADQAILIGTDCPGLDADYLRQASAALHNGHDVVLGPAEDGGYVLIGMNANNPAIFAQITWSSAQVLAQTLDKLQQQRLRYHLLSTQRDIDRPQDLKILEELGILPDPGHEQANMDMPP